jgi:hypothetical protein
VFGLVMLAACPFRGGTQASGDGGGDGGGPPGVDAAEPDGGMPDATAMIDAPADAFVPMFSYGCENGVPGSFTGVHLSGVPTSNGDTVNQATSVPHTGTYSCRCQTNSTPMNQATPFLTFSDRNEIYVGMWVRLASGFPNASWVRLISVADIGPPWVNMAAVDLFPDLHLGVSSETDGTNDIHMSTATLPATGWHHVELWARTATNGRLALAIDGQMQVDVAVNTGTATFHLVHTGISWQGDHTRPAEVYVDDVVID